LLCTFIQVYQYQLTIHGKVCTFLFIEAARLCLPVLDIDFVFFICVCLLCFGFWMTLSRNDWGRNFCIAMQVPYPKKQVKFVYSWPWPTFNVTRGPVIDLLLIVGWYLCRSPEIINVETSALVCRCLTSRCRSGSYMIDLDLLSRWPGVIDLLLISGWYLQK
jgi:hypothetical protein